MVFAWIETTKSGIYYNLLNYLNNYIMQAAKTNELFHKGTQRRHKVRKEKAVIIINYLELEYQSPFLLLILLIISFRSSSNKPFPNLKTEPL